MNGHLKPRRIAIFGAALLLITLVATIAPRLPARAEPGSAVVAQTDAVWVPYDPNPAAAYADFYTTPPNDLKNKDGCYIQNNGQCLLTTNTEPPGTLDAPHFIGCALHTGGILTVTNALNGTIKRTCGPDAPISTSLPGDVVSTFADILTLTQPTPRWWREVSFDEARGGDIIGFSLDNTNLCWIGMVVGRDDALGQVIFATHSRSLRNQRIDRDPLIKNTPNETYGQCYGSDRDGDGDFLEYAQEVYIRVNGDTAAPNPPVLESRDLDDTGGQAVYSWPAASDDQSGVKGYRLETFDGANWNIALPANPSETFPNPSAALAIGMCSSLRVRVVAVDKADNQATSNEVEVRIFQRGDLNHDGLVDSADLDQLEAAIASASPLPAADYTGDGALNSDDALWLADRLGESCDIRMSAVSNEGA